MNSLYSVHLSTAKSWRGGENQIWLLARGLQARGQRVLVIAPHNAPLHERCADQKIRTENLAFHGELDPFGTLRLISLLRKEKPDILHLHDAHAVLPGQIAGRMFSPKDMSVVAHRRTVFDLKSRWKYSGRIERVIAISNAVREKLIAADIPAARIRTVYSGLEFAENFAREGAEAVLFRKTHAIPEDALLIGHAAALTSEKRQLDMIAALSAVHEKLKTSGGPPVHLALAGIGDQEDTLRREAQTRGLGAQIHFAGFMNDLRALWASSSIALFTSEAEGLCTALIEAQGAGLPAVVTRAGGMVEVVDDGNTGFIADVGNVEQIASALERLCRDQGLRQTLGKAAAARVREKFSADVMVNGIERVYRELRG